MTAELTEPYETVDSAGRLRLRASVESRLWLRVNRSAGPDGCWLWQGHRSPDGYGQISVRGRRLALTHRVAYELKKGAIPPGMFVLHSCDNPPCCNPAHLRVGGMAENMADMVSRGRSPHMRNERSGKAKLTDAQVAEIRQRRADGATCADLGREFGAHPAHISRITRYLRRPAEADAEAIVAHATCDGQLTYRGTDPYTGREYSAFSEVLVLAPESIQPEES